MKSTPQSVSRHMHMILSPLSGKEHKDLCENKRYRPSFLPRSNIYIYIIFCNPDLFGIKSRSKEYSVQDVIETKTVQHISSC